MAGTDDGSGSFGRKPSTGRPVSFSSIGASRACIRAVQLFSRMPAMWLGVRKFTSPFSSAASVRL